jgi:hypothetical protein
MVAVGPKRFEQGGRNRAAPVTMREQGGLPGLRERAFGGTEVETTRAGLCHSGEVNGQDVQLSAAGRL